MYRRKHSLSVNEIEMCCSRSIIELLSWTTVSAAKNILCSAWLVPDAQVLEEVAEEAVAAFVDQQQVRRLMSRQLCAALHRPCYIATYLFPGPYTITA